MRKRATKLHYMTDTATETVAVVVTVVVAGGCVSLARKMRTDGVMQ